MDHNPAVSSGSLKTKISLKNGYSQPSLPFYGIKQKLPPPSQVLGSDDLLARFDLSSSYNRFCGPKKPKEDLGSFLNGICGISNLNIKDPSCSLRALIDKPPITGREIMGLSSGAMSGFRLAPGPIPENYRFFEILPGDTALLNGQEIGGAPDRTASNNSATDVAQPPIRLKRALEEFEASEYEKKAKKPRGEEKERKSKKKKKDKKKKKNDDETKRPKEAKPFY